MAARSRSLVPPPHLWATHELCKHWQRGRDSGNPGYRGTVPDAVAWQNKQIVCYYRWVANRSQIASESGLAVRFLRDHRLRRRRKSRQIVKRAASCQRFTWVAPHGILWLLLLLLLLGNIFVLHALFLGLLRLLLLLPHTMCEIADSFSVSSE